MRRLPPLGAIQAFVHVGRLGSLKAAAESLALSPPALTRRIQSLEQFIGTTLLDRQHNSVLLNQAGIALMAELAPNIDALSAAIERASAPSKEVKLRVAVPSLFGSQQLVPALRSLRDHHPNISIDLETGANRLGRLEEGLDAAIVIAREVDPRYYSRLLKRDVIMAVASRDYAEGPDALTGPAGLADVPVLLHRDMPDNFTAWCAAIGIGPVSPTTINYYDSGQMILDAAAERMGVAFMMRSHLAGSHDDRLIQLFDQTVPSPYSYWFACTPAGMARPAVSQFHDWLFDSIPLDEAA